jgi:myo-inositol 2-dehydrogenase/D-chiro-inositol 1-dehydrogenase
MGMERVRLGLAGCGGRGRHHLDRLTGFDDVEIVAVADASAQNRDSVGQTYGVAARYADLADLLDDTDVDAVVLATPAHLNAGIAAVSLDRGVDTLMEKPPGLSSAETRDLRDRAAASGARCMVAWDRRFNPWIRAAHAAVTERGPLLQLVGEFHKPTKTIHDPRFPEQLRDNMLFETPIHAIDAVRSLAGADVTSVHSVVRRATGSYKDVHAALVTFANGCVAQLTNNYTAGGRLERYELHGDGVSAYLEGVSGGQLQIVDESPRPLQTDGPDAATAQARHFIDCLRGDRPIGPPAADLDEAVKTMELCESILAGLVDD